MAVPDVILFKKIFQQKQMIIFLKKNNSNTKAKSSKIPGEAVFVAPASRDSSACCFVIAVMALAALLQWVPQSDGSYGSN